MITNVRIEEAERSLRKDEALIRAHVEKIRAIAQSGFLEKWNGKKVSRKVLNELARMYGSEEIKYNGKTLFRDAETTWSYCSVPGYGTPVPQVKVFVCEGWSYFDIPLIGEIDGSGRIYIMSEEKTREVWDRIIERRIELADREAEASKLVRSAAAGYNRIERLAVSLADKLDAKDLKAKVLCAFGGEICDRIIAFTRKEKGVV